MDDQSPLLDEELEVSEEVPGFRIVLVGKTGNGKSATGNTILGRRYFRATVSPNSVTTECQKTVVTREDLDGQTLSVVDTPGLYDPNRQEELFRRTITRCISLAAPGPHVFLIVLRPNRFTNEERGAVRDIQEMFGEQAACYTMALFIQGDDLENDGVSIDTFIGENQELNDFISQCGGRYHVFNNRDTDPSQVRALLSKIESMVQENGGTYYTNDMFQAAERAIREEQRRLLRESPSMSFNEARRKAEGHNPYALGAALGAVVGIGAGVGAECAVVGACAGAIGGPVGAAAGALVGVAVGAIVAVANGL